MTQTLRVRKLIEKDIVSGALRAGERLDEEVLAKRFGVSRTPIREALMLLQAADLVERKPRAGTVVKERTLKVLVQSMEVHGALEAFAAYLAARRASKADLAEMKSALDMLMLRAAEGDPDAYYDANCVFHYAIYAASHNDVLQNKATTLGESLMPFYRAQHHSPGWIQKTLSEHVAIYEAIEAREADRVSEIIRRHVHFDSDQFADLAAQFD